ncbi:helix-turn-helix domain-containing protein [Neobacillus terrae]|uniref:helix-turn-helix domain-containing protein n=1 Tax=Neobacillus terrae TaxID=3034837 RepID=UPI00140B6BA0|nr:helix-turn-helix domain-containing protein [Neobacillus terrae]NHM33004.1 helix-turn-helix domain-containing protein [Neobacillus terrae]
MKTQIPRHNNIGDKLRAKRKENGMTLEELAKGICSVGKISNIENGHISVSVEDLTKFSRKLNTPLSFFSDPNIDVKIRELDYQKQKINDLIGLQHWEGVKSELFTFKENIVTYQIPSRKIDFNFLAGIYYLNTQQSESAIEFLTNVIESKDSSNYSLLMKLKAYSAIASILFSQKKVSQSVILLEKALELSKENPTITKEERDNIYFNLSILHVYMGAYYKALKCINNVKHHLISPLETEYIKILIRFLENTAISDIREDLLSLREKLQQNKDKDGILRGWALTIYTLLTSYPTSDLTIKLREEFWSDTELICQMDKYKETGLSLMQLGIYVLLKKDVDMSFIHELINRTKPLLQHIQTKLIIARNYYLEGKFLKKYTKDSDSALLLFQNALNVLESNYDGLIKADILYEISKIKSLKNEAVIALELYHSHLESQFLYTHFHELTLPPFKYNF